MRTNDALVEHLIKRNVLKNADVISAFKAVNRADFVIDTYLDYAYFDRALPIGYDQTISQPTTVAIMLEHLKPLVQQ